VLSADGKVTGGQIGTRVKMHMLDPHKEWTTHPCDFTQRIFIMLTHSADCY
jgi:hypothetical protein